MGEAVLSAKFNFAPLNADEDTNRIGWVARDEVMQAGDRSIRHRHSRHPCRSEQFPVRGNDE
jgi:hypothetical protein